MVAQLVKISSRFYETSNFIVSSQTPKNGRYNNPLDFNHIFIFCFIRFFSPNLGLDFLSRPRCFPNKILCTFLHFSASSSSVFFLYIVFLTFSWIFVYFVAFLFLVSSPSLISFPHALQTSCRIVQWVSASVTLLWTWISFLTSCPQNFFDPFIGFISV